MCAAAIKRVNVQHRVHQKHLQHFRRDSQHTVNMCIAPSVCSAECTLPVCSNHTGDATARGRQHKCMPILE